MDWSPIIAGGITGLLSGAVSGNLIQYALDNRRIRDKNRHQLLDEWDQVLNDEDCTYSDIISHPSYELLKSFVSSESRRRLTVLEAETGITIKALISRILEPKTDQQEALEVRDELVTVGYKAKYKLVATLKH
jgi:hypothetical protein